MTGRLPFSSRLWPGWQALLAGFVAYFVLARLSLALASLHGNISPVWPVTGLAIWLVITRGPGMVLAIAVGHLILNIYSSALPVPTAIGMTAGNVAEALLGAWLWRWVRSRSQNRFAEHAPLLAALSASWLAPLVAASAGTASLVAGGIIPTAAVATTWLTWWIGDALGGLFVLPMLLSAPELWRWVRAGAARDAHKIAVVLAMAAAVSGAAFFTSDHADLIFGTFPVLLAAAVWIEAPVAGWLAFLLMAAAVMGTCLGHGAFVTGRLNEDLLHLQGFLAALAVMAQILPTFRGRGNKVAIIMLLVGWTLSGWVFSNMRRNLAESNEANFTALITNANRDIEQRLQYYTEALRGVTGLWLASKSVERDEWRAFAENLDLNTRYPGIQGIGIVDRVPVPELDEFQQRIREDGLPDFAVRPFPGAKFLAGQDHYVITRLEPEARNRPVLGLDLATETMRRQAAELARDTGEPRITGRIPLIQDDTKRTGFALYVPVYRRGAPRATVAERRAALQAWIYAPFLTEKFLDGVLARYRGIIQLYFFESGPTDPAHLVYSSEQIGPHWPKFRVIRSLELAGQTFTLAWTAGPSFKPSGQSALVFTSFGLVFSSLLLAGFVRSLQDFRRRAEALVDERTRELKAEVEEREQIHKTLRAVSNFQEAILRSASHAIISTTPEGIIRVFNPAAERLLGYTRAELVDRATPALFHDPAEMVERASALSVELGLPVEPGFEVFVIKSGRGLPNEHEWTYLRKDGVRVPVSLAVTAVRNDQGDVIGFLGVAVDLTEQKRALRQAETARRATEHALHELELQREALDQHAIVSIADYAGRIQHVNDKFCAISGYSREDVIGQNHRVISSRHHSSEFWREFWQMIEAGKIWHGELCNRSKQGTHYWLDATVVPFRDPNGKISRFVAICTDITEQKRQGEALQLAKEGADAANRAKSEFLAVMSHEIRTPMNAVLGFAELLGETPLNEAQREFVATLRASGEGLLQLINDILDYSKIEAGKLEVRPTNFDAIPVVESVARILSAQAQRKGLALTVHSAPGLSRVLHADPSRARQIVMNLVGNALKFTARGSVTIDVVPWEIADRHGLKFLITDTGPGIPPDQQKRLFQKFVQVDASYSREAGGTGLGLAICKRLVEAMGGQIGFESFVGRGSTFWFTLPGPVSVDPEPPRGAKRVDPNAAVAAEVEDAGGRPLRVLLVDDNPVNRTLALAFLDTLNCVTTTANDGFAAVELTRAETFDLALMDCQMPGMNGFQATMEIRAWEAGLGRGRRMPIIALTANAIDFRDRCAEAGMDSFLTKPYQLADLKAAIAAVMSGCPAPEIEMAAPVSVPSAETAMDRARALQLADGNPELLAVLARSFLPQSETLMSAIREAVAARNVVALREHAHALKGSVSVFAAAHVSAAALALEKPATPLDWSELARACDRLDTELERLRPEIAAVELDEALP